MNSRYFVSSLVALLAGFGFLPHANAYSGPWCGMQGGTSNFEVPECSDSKGYGDGSNLGVLENYITNVCSKTDANKTVDFVVTYPDPAYYSGQKMFPLVVVQHGGGLDDTFYDRHGTAHPVSPYEQLSMVMAHKGAVVITAKYAGSSNAPYDAADQLNEAIGCFRHRVTSKVCATSSSEPCFTALVDKVSPEYTFVGHSSGAVIGLYLPGYDGPAVRGIIMIDPAKGQWLNQAPKALANEDKKVPVVHLYPDFYGPAQDANNELFRLGYPKTCVNGSKAGYGCKTNSNCPGGGTCSNNSPPVAGPYIPLGIRELPTVAGGPNPNTGHHQVHHCMGMSNNGAINYFPPGHEAFCDNSVSCPAKPSIDCGGQQYCGPQRKCIVNIKGNAFWGLGASLDLQTSDNRITNRYVAAYAACFGADYGNYYQPWVNGMDRYYDDAGDGRSCTKNGYPDATCGAHADYNSCVLDPVNDCHWANAQDKYCVGGSNEGDLCSEPGTGLQWTCNDGGYCSGLGKVIRINNNDQNITDYGVPVSGDKRFYTSMSGYDAGTGQFDEQTEKLGTTPHAANAPNCGAGAALLF